MNLDEKQKKEIEEIMAKADCPKDYECFKNEFEKLCRANWMGNYTECAEFGACPYLDTDICPYKAGVLFGSGYICQCELRQYVKKNLRK